MIVLDRSKNLEKFLEYFHLLVFILSFTNPFVRKNIEIAIYLLIFLSFLSKKFFSFSRKDFQALIIILFFISFEFIHALIFNLDNLKTTIRVFSYFAVSYFTVKILRHNFLAYFVNITVALSILSLLMYAMAYATPFTYKILYIYSEAMFPLDLDVNNYRTPTFILYTFDPAYFSENNILRNAGFTWEAGGLATYLNFAIVFNLMNNFPKGYRQFIADWRNKILLITMATTFSTAGYVTLFIVMAIYFLNKFTISNFIFIIIFIPVAIYLYFTLDFLGQKINEQLDQASISQNRFGAAMLDFEDIIKRPFFGWSRDFSVLFKTNDYIYELHRPNGITNFLRCYGFIYVLSYILILYASTQNMAKNLRLKNYKLFPYLIITVLIMMGFSQLVMHTLFTMSLLFLGIVSFNFKTLNISDYKVLK